MIPVEMVLGSFERGELAMQQATDRHGRVTTMLHAVRREGVFAVCGYMPTYRWVDGSNDAGVCGRCLRQLRRAGLDIGILRTQISRRSA